MATSAIGLGLPGHVGEPRDLGWVVGTVVRATAGDQRFAQKIERWLPDADTILGHHDPDLAVFGPVECAGAEWAATEAPLGFRAHVFKEFGKRMSLHDFRRAAATFVASHAPEKVGIIPGVLNHRSPEVGERWYNLARSTEAGRRHGETVAALRKRLMSFNTPERD